MSQLKSLKDLSKIKGKKVFLRVDFNVPISGGRVSDATKIEKLEEYSISIDENEYLLQEKAFYENNSLSKEDLKGLFTTNNIKYSEFKNYLIYEISWQKLVSGIYYRLASASEIEIEEIILKNPELTTDIAKNIIIQKQLDLKSSKMIRDLFNEATIEYK